MDSKELLQQQLADIDAQQSAKTKPIDIAKAPGIRYNAEMQAMIRRVRMDINELLVPQIKYLEPEYTADAWFDTIGAIVERLRDKYSSPSFKQWAQRIANNFVASVDTHNRNQINSQRSVFGIDAYTDKTVSDYLQASAYDNARLIKTIPEQYLQQVETLVTTNMRAGLRPSAIVEQLQNQFGTTKNRAKMIARDQSSKVSNGLARKRMISAGIKFFRWVTSKDERVRSRHAKIANTMTKYGLGIYSWDELPLDDKGRPIAPGDDYSCRCTAQPVLQAEVDRNIAQGKTNPDWKIAA